ncbi:hypothetical protein BHE74_00043688 [Ensete ventricosum]|nr:hypothetical protein BHE74_00043688 [Ensete ventricosum]
MLLPYSPLTTISSSLSLSFRWTKQYISYPPRAFWFLRPRVVDDVAISGSTRNFDRTAPSPIKKGGGGEHLRH